MNMTDFLYKFQNDKQFDLPKEYHIDYDNNKITEKWIWRTRQDFKKWLNHRALNMSFAVPYGINHNAFLWPSIDEVKKSKTSKFSKVCHQNMSYSLYFLFILTVTHYIL